jgi:short-subunit dehydrogenase
VLSLSETLASELRAANIQVSVVMPTYFKTELLDSIRGPEHLRAFAAARMSNATYPATAVANDVLLMASAGKLYILAPKETHKLWRMKRWMPEWFLKKVAATRD